jgi:beta-glucosidase-like glycosyl hydrolase
MDSDDKQLSPEVRFHLIRKMERLKVVALSGTQVKPHEAKYLEFHRVAGVILFERNVHSLTQMAELVGNVGEWLTEDGHPPLVMADHEGDFVAELKRIIGVPPAPLAIAATRDLDLARDVAFETGKAMMKLGVNTVLSPVADCFLDAASPITGLRTFGRDPERVAEYVARTIEGFRSAGVLTCAKHFPGHGSTADDSHEMLPEVKKSLDELRAADLVPFRRAVAEDVDMVMMSHVAYPMGSDQLVPASFDARLIRTLLREEMGYEGVVITDALEMAAARWYTRGRFGAVAGGSEHALLAGSDLLLHARPVPEQVQLQGDADPVMSVDVIDTIVKTLERVVDRSRIDEKLEEAARGNEALGNVLSLLNESSGRVQRLRGRLQPAAAARPAGGGKVIAFDSYPSVPHVYRSVAERSVTALTDWDQFQPLGADRRAVVMPVVWQSSGSLHGQDVEGFVATLCKQFPGWRSTGVVRGFDDAVDGVPQPVIEGGGGGVVDAARFSRFDGTTPRDTIELGEDEDLLVVFACRGTPSEEFMAALQTFSEDVSPAVVIVAGWPVSDWVPESSAALWSMGASVQAASAVAQILGGHADPEGNLEGLAPGF